MLLHVVLGQLDPHGETLHDEDDPGELEGDLISVAPGEGIDEICGVRTEDDPTEGRDGGLADVHALFDEGGAEHEERGEAAEDDVDQMRPIDGEVVPGHVLWRALPGRLRGVVGLSRRRRLEEAGLSRTGGRPSGVQRVVGRAM